MIGEMRDSETIDTAIKAAETGHLLISTLHTPDAISTIMRIMAMFPPQEQAVVRIRLAESLHAVISQRLLPRADGKGRVAAAEILVVTPTIRDLIIDGGNLPEIRDYMAEGKEQYGMQTFDQHLTELVLAGDVSYEVAHANASKPSDFELQMRTFGGLSKNAGQSGGGTSTGGSRAAQPQTETAPADHAFDSGLDFLNP
jgi:twitching motility protein PilT